MMEDRGSNVSSRQYSPTHCENGDHRGSNVSMLQSSLAPADAAYNAYHYFGITTNMRIYKSNCILFCNRIMYRTGTVAV